MAQTIYKRQLVGQQSGVQVNMPIDRVERMLAEAGDQTFAVVGKFSRGRIDKPFLVSSSKINRYLGSAKSMRADAQNEAYVQIFEAFSTGAAAAVVSRLSSKQAINRWIVLNHGDAGVSLSENMPSAENTDWLIALKMADCINDGVFVEFEQGDTLDEITVTIKERNLDSKGNETGAGEVLYTFTGSTNPEAKDDVGNAYFLADVAAKFYGDWIDVVANGHSQANTILEADAIKQKAVKATVMPYTDNGILESEDYRKATLALGKTTLQYRYLMGWSSNQTMVSTLIEVAQKYNRIMMQEVSGNLSPEAAIAFKDTFQYDAQGGMYCLWIWSPLRRNDSTGATGLYQFGTIGQKIGRACARNAVINEFGLPALNQPIAGKDFYILGVGLEQIYNPDDVELAMLAKARINPALYVTYHDGSGYVWDDSFSGAKKNGISRLENAVEISYFLQEQVGKYARSLLQKPMETAISLMTRFVEDTLQACKASKWLIPSASLNGKAYTYTIKPNERNPEDEMMVTINIAIDGVVRRIFISQNLYSRS